MTQTSEAKDSKQQRSNTCARARYTVPSGLRYATEMYVREVVMASLDADRRCDKGFFNHNGIDRERVAAVINVDLGTLESEIKRYVDKVLRFKHPTGMPLSALDANSLFDQIRETVEGQTMYVQYLKAGVSNPLLIEFFGKRSREIALDRAAHGVETKIGRKQVPKDEDADRDAYDAYLVEIAKNHDPIQSYMAVHLATGYDIDFIYKSVNQRIERKQSYLQNNEHKLTHLGR